MKTRFLLTLIVAGATVIIFDSCQKNLEQKIGQDEIAGTPLPGQTTYCRIESIWEKQNPSEGQRFILILYDEYENPTAVTVPRIGTAIPYRTFKYDQWHRLREYIGTYGNGYFMFWHFYGYDNSGRIAYDTVYTLGQIQNEQPVGSIWIRMSTIEYDSQNRISRVVTTSNITPTEINTYNYDAAGNLIRPGVTYDNKMNLNRTNDIWMFLGRNYSMNNVVVADTYNSSGLPTKINTSSFVSFADMEIYLNHSEISYGCRPAYW